MFNQKCWILFYSMNFLKKSLHPYHFWSDQSLFKMSSSFYCPPSLGKQYFTNFKVGRLCWKRKESGKLLSATIYPLTMGKRAKCGKTKRVLLFFSKSYSWKEAGGDFFFIQRSIIMQNTREGMKALEWLWKMVEKTPSTFTCNV